ncbi:MAG TPA: LysR family transcriptional regulator [Gammaproteobacteria bacterium]|nr:LysR family transcriptional regulator [Gammaproteobacteria bacterium]
MRVFAKVAQCRNFSRAAEELDLSRAMVSKHVNRIEDALGVRLIHRTTRQLSLTEAGQQYLARCQQILADVEEAEQVIVAGNYRPKGTLRVAAPPSFGMFHLTPAIAAYKSRYPEVDVVLLLHDRVPDLAEEELDLAIRLGELEDSTLIAHQLALVHTVVCGSPAYLRRHGRPAHPEELLRHNCLRLRYPPLKNDTWVFHGPRGKFEIPVRGTFESNIADALRVAAIEGIGLILQPAYMVVADVAAGRLETILEDYDSESVELHAVYLHRRHLSAKVRTFVEFLKDRFHRSQWTAAFPNTANSNNVPSMLPEHGV